MDNRKRARLDVSLGASGIDAGIGVGGAAFNSSAAAGISGTHSIFLSSAATSNSADAVGMLPGNVFLTICGDENSDDSQEYLTIDSNTLAHIKQEQELLAAGNGIISSSSSSSSTQATQTLPLQYRIVNQLQRQLPTHMDAISSSDSNGALSSTLSPMQLPSGCEIYLVKEYVDSVPAMLTEDSELLQSMPNTTTIKVEPDSCATSTTAVMAGAAGSDGIIGEGNGGAAVVACAASSAASDSVQIVRNTLPGVLRTNGTPIITTATITTTTTTTVAAANSDAHGAGNAKRSYILEAYKKRDDKRRATHNEVERRRRDKINSWIFKLKEMLPTDMSQHNSTNHNSASNNNINQPNVTVTPNANGVAEQHLNNTNSNNNSNSLSNNTNNGNSNSNSNSRPPPSDSKSQILIKACEYIKAMQDEIKSLRECLTENERLRLSNQRLQNELNKMRNERSCSISAFNSSKSFNNNFNITLNSLNDSIGAGSTGNSNSNSSGNSPGGISFCTNGGLITNAANAATFTKRELIIRDYVD